MGTQLRQYPNHVSKLTKKEADLEVTIVNWKHKESEPYKKITHTHLCVRALLCVWVDILKIPHGSIWTQVFLDKTSFKLYWIDWMANARSFNVDPLMLISVFFACLSVNQPLFPFFGRVTFILCKQMVPLRCFQT